MNPKDRRPHPPTLQTGTALLTALVILLMMSLTALSAVRFSTMGVRMGANEELAVEAFQTTQSVVDATLADPDNVRVQGIVGERFCTAGVQGCSGLYQIQLADGLFDQAIADGKIQIEVERMGPDLAPPPRATGSSLTRFKAARFRVGGTYDETGAGLSRDEIDQGVLILVPSY